MTDVASREVAARIVASDAENGLIKIVRSRDSPALLDAVEQLLWFASFYDGPA